MSGSEKPRPVRVLLVGPLPPPHGGSRVSFARFLEYVQKDNDLSVFHVDLPVRKRRADGKYGGVARTRTALRLLTALGRVPFTDRVALFASRGTAFNYGLFLIVVAGGLGKPVAMRLFGGRPYLSVKSRRGLGRRFTEWALSFTSSISLETSVGRADFPESIRSRVRAIRGYRSRRQTPTPQREDDTFSFAYAGRVDRSKGIDVLLAACEKLAGNPSIPSFRVDCFGAPSEEIESMSRAHRFVRLMGVVENETFRERLPSYDAFLYPSVYDNEGHPGALIEAMLSGLPVVCTSLPTIMEIVSDEVEGLTVKPGDADDLASAMHRVISDPELRAKLADGSRRKGLTFDEDVVIPLLLEEMGLRGGNI